MHEHAIAHEIIHESEKQGDVKSITVEVGALAHLPAKDFEKVLKTMVKWDVNVVEKPAKVRCVCGFIGKPKILEHSHDVSLFECPKCHNIPDVIEGNEIILKKVVVK
jgi:Zn finger protein HypA/HybF involved in hydrogenase expression